MRSIILTLSLFVCDATAALATIRVAVPPLRELSGQVTASFIAAADVDADGRADVILPGSTTLQGKPSGAYFVYTHAVVGAVSWESPQVYYTFDQSPFIVLGIADETGDGKADLVTVEVVPGSTERSLTVWPQEWHGLFSSGQQIPGDVIVTGFRDLNGDGVADLVGIEGQRVYAMTGRRAGGFFEGPLLSSIGVPLGTSFRGATLVDANGDPFPDIALITSGGSVIVLIGNGDATFRPWAQFASSGDAIGIATLRRASGATVLVTLHRAGFPGQPNVFVWSGDMAGHYTRVAALPAGVQPRVVANADLDLDHHDDLILGEEGNGFGRANYVVTTTATGDFVSEQLPSEGGPDGAVVDADGDGRPDLLFVNSPIAPRDVLVYENTSDTPPPARRRAVRW